ncbi:MbnP family protein [Portibacter marinus]|uniref:MbnP family protein n=1 Tax=Portibacter marinus TaxID=2898660 RepID=UPI001F456421|nr:MbnP family protein [Portibacter marinus]
MRSYIVLSLIVIWCISCYEKQEGCLDIRARNYDFTADEPCEDCCTFPNMQLRVTHTWGDTTLIRDSVYTNELGQKLKILKAEFLLSDISLLLDNEAYTVIDSVEVIDVNGSIIARADNFAHVRSDRFNYTIGSFDKAQDFTAISFVFGVNGRFTNNDLVEDNTMFNDTTLTYTNFKMQYEFNDDTLNYTLRSPVNTVDLIIPGNFNLPIGTDFTIQIFVDYQKLLNDINVLELGQASTDQLILERIPFFFGL